MLLSSDESSSRAQRVQRGVCGAHPPWSRLQPCSPPAIHLSRGRSPAVARSRLVTALPTLCPCSAHALPPRYDKLPVLLPELVFSWVPHQYFLAPPGSMGRIVAAKHVQARYERGERGGRRQSAAEKELGTSVDEGMLLMATAPRHVHRMYTARVPLPRAPTLAAEVGLYWCREPRSRLPPHQGWVWVAGGGGVICGLRTAGRADRRGARCRGHANL